MKPTRVLALLLATLSLLIVGCIDKMETVLRDRLALETEMLDVVMHIVDEEGRKEYTTVWSKRFRDRKEAIEDRRQKLEESMRNDDKKVFKAWQDLDKYVKGCIQAGRYGKAEDLDPPPDKFYLYYIREMVELHKCFERKNVRMDKLFER